MNNIDSILLSIILGIVAIFFFRHLFQPRCIVVSNPVMNQVEEVAYAG